MDPNNPYAKILSGYGIKQPEAPSTSTVNKKQEGESTNPYMNVVNNYKTAERAGKFGRWDDEAKAEQEKTLNPGIWADIKGTVKNLPGAVKSIVTKPQNAVLGGVTGLFDAAPAIVNSIWGAVGGKGRLPMPGQTLANYLIDNTPFFDQSQEGRDVAMATGEGAKQYAGYRYAGAVTKPILGSTKVVAGKKTVVDSAASVIAGDVLGGQLVADPEMTWKDRGRQALFDTVFGVAEVGVGKGFNKLTGKSTPDVPGTKVDPTSPDVPPEVASYFGEDAVELPTTNPMQTPPDPKTAFKKKNLGKNPENGEKILASHEYDHKTGNSIIYTDPMLDKIDSNPAQASAIRQRLGLPEGANIKQFILDHEQGHVFDKRINQGNRFSSDLAGGNQAGLDNVLNKYATKVGQSVEEVSTKLSAEIEALSGGRGATPNERFAEAFSRYRVDPKEARNVAPTFADFLENTVPVEPKFSSSVSTASTIKGEKMVRPTQGEPEVKLSQDEKDMLAHADRPERYVVDDKDPKPLAGIRPDNQVRFNQGQNSPVVVVMSSTDKRIVQAANYKSKSGYMNKGTVKEVMDMYDVTEAEAQKFITQRAAQLKELARANATKDKMVVLNVMDRPSDALRAKAKPKPKTETTLREGDIPTPTKTDTTPAPKKQASTEPSGEARTTVANKSSKIADTGLDTGKRVDKRSSFNPEKINGPEDLEILLNKVDASSKNASENRISKSNEDIKDLARVTGLTPEELLAAKPGSIVNSETMQAARTIVVNAADDLSQTMKTINPKTATGPELAVMKEKFLRLVALQKAVAGFRTEASNLFRSLQLKVSPNENFQLQMLAEELKAFDIASADDLASFSQKVAKEFSMTAGQKAGNRALSTWYAAILSGPKTTVRNVLSTTANMLTDLASRAANPKTIKEVPTIISAWLKGLPEATAKFKEALKGQIPDDNKFMNTNFGMMKEEIWKGKWSTYGRIVESVGRFLNAQDTFMRTLLEKGEGASLKAHGPEMSDELSNAIARSYAESTIYRGQPKGAVIEATRDLAQQARHKIPALKVIIPFVDTVANVLDRNFDYIPITGALRLRGSVIERQVQRIAKNHGLTKEADLAVIRRRIWDQQVGRLIVGSAITVGAVTIAQSGVISGAGPKNYQEKLQLQRSGWRPNSIKLGDTWVPYSFLGPLGGILAMVGNVHDKAKYDNAPDSTLMSHLSNGMVGWAQSQLNQSFLSGVADIFEVMSGDKNPKQYFTDLGAGLVPIPAAYSQTKDMIFRQQYETKDIVSKIRQKLGLTGEVFGQDALNPRLDAFGVPIQSDLIYAVTPSRETKNVVNNFLIANDVVVTVPLPQTKYADPLNPKTQTKLTPEEYQKYAKSTGEEIYKALQIALPRLNTLDADKKKREVEKIVDDIRTRARRQILLSRKP